MPSDHFFERVLIFSNILLLFMNVLVMLTVLEYLPKDNQQLILTTNGLYK